MERMTVGTDDWGQPTAPTWATHLDEQACWAWSEFETVSQTPEKTVSLPVMRMMLPLGTDVNEDDMILDVRDRRNALLFRGPFAVDGIE